MKFVGKFNILMFFAPSAKISFITVGGCNMYTNTESKQRDKVIKRLKVGHTFDLVESINTIKFNFELSKRCVV